MDILRKNRLFLAVFIGVFVNSGIFGQIQIESSYMFPSNYRDDTNTETGGRGDFKDIWVGIQIPVYVTTNEFDQQTAWAIALQGAYASMDNTGLSNDKCISRLLNTSLGVFHQRPLSEKWSLMASLGGGVYSDLSEFTYDSILVEAKTLFIWHIFPSLYLGLGVTLNNIIGYPMVFPAFYLDWQTGTRFEVKITLYDIAQLSIGMKINDVFTVRLLGQSRGMSAVVKHGNETRIFTQQFTVIGLQPEIYINKIISIPVIAGVSVIRESFFQKRDLNSYYQSSFNILGNNPSFAVSPYISIGLKLFVGE